MDSIKCFITSKKALTLIENKKYSFLIRKGVKKNLIKRILENFFNVKITKLNSCNLPRKQKRLGKFKGYKTQFKKVIITLGPNDNIQLFSNI